MSARLAPLAVLAAGLALVGLAPGGGAGQDEVRAAAVGDTIRVGDVVPVAVRVVVERGERVVWPDTLPLPGEDLENAARVRERVDTLADGRLAVTGVYAVTPWRPGEAALPELPVQVIAGDEATRTLTASLPAIQVASVLPADTVGIEPRPLKDVIGASRVWWPLILLLVALVLIAAAVIWWLRRRRARAPEVAVGPMLTPREAALEALDTAREAGLVERGDMREFYTRVSEAVRGYAAALEPSWGEDLTTTEIVARFRAGLGPAAATELSDLLRPADQVKFAQRRPDGGTALAEWEAARAWVVRFDGPRAPASVEEAA